MPLQTWTARFVVDHGRVTEEGGLLRTFLRRRLDEADVDLHILAEPQGAKGDDLGPQAIDNIGRLFLDDKLSLTGGLLRATRSTHQTLLEWNRRSLPSDQVAVSVTAAAISGTAVYLLQAGQGLSFHLRAGRLRRLDPGAEARAPLGEGQLEPSLRRIDLEAGDVVLCASTALGDVLDQPLLEALLNRGSDEALPELYLLTRDLPNFSLFAITCLESEAPDEEEEPALAPDAGADGETEQGPVLVQRAPQTPAAPPPAARPLIEAGAAQTAAGQPPLDISRPVVRLRGEGSIGRAEYPRTTSGGRGLRLALDQPRLLAMVAAAALVLFVGAFAVPDLIRENRGEKIASLLQAAQVQMAEADASADPAVQRRLYEEARSLAAEALRLDPESQVAGDMRRQAALQLDALNAIFDLGPMTRVATLSQQVTGAMSLDGLLLGDGSAYLLDGRGGRVLALALDNPGQVLTVFQEGEVYGDAPAAAPTAFTWQETPDGGRLLVLDAERKLFALRPGSLPERLPLRRTASWASVAGIAAYDGNLYVLDPAADQVHRYLPAASGYDSEPSTALTGDTDLAEAVALAVENDIYVLKRSGEALRFQGGAPAGFGLNGIDRLLTGPTSIDVVPEAGEVYIADSGNKRVVVAGSEGEFRRQYVSNDFTDLRALTVDAAAGQLYVVVGDALLTAPLVR